MEDAGDQIRDGWWPFSFASILCALEEEGSGERICERYETDNQRNDENDNHG